VVNKDEYIARTGSRKISACRSVTRRYCV